MNFLKFFLLVGLAITLTAQADDMAIEVMAIELTDSSDVPFHADDPLGRGIYDRKEKKALRLYCQQRKEQNCMQAQYGISTFDPDRVNALGNIIIAEGVTPIGAVLTLKTATDVQQKIKELKKTLANNRRWKYPNLNFNLTKKAWKKRAWKENGGFDLEGYLNPELDRLFGNSFGDWTILPAIGSVGTGIVLGVGKLGWTAAAPWLLIAIPATYYAAPTIVDLSVNAAKITVVPFVILQRGLAKTFGKNYKKYAFAMTDTSRDWQFEPLRASHKVFTNVLNSIESFSKEGSNK